MLQLVARAAGHNFGLVAAQRGADRRARPDIPTMAARAVLSAPPRCYVFLRDVGTGWPLPLIFVLFVTNCLEALIAAGGLYLLSDTPGDSIPCGVSWYSSRPR